MQYACPPVAVSGARTTTVIMVMKTSSETNVKPQANKWNVEEGTGSEEAGQNEIHTAGVLLSNGGVKAKAKCTTSVIDFSSSWDEMWVPKSEL